MRMVAALIYGTRRFSLSVNKYARNASKFNRVQMSKIFALEGVYTASETWVGHEQRFLPQMYSLTYCSTMQRLRLKEKRLIYSLTWCNTIVQFSKYGRSLNSIDEIQMSRPTAKFVYARDARILYLLIPLSQQLAEMMIF